MSKLLPPTTIIFKFIYIILLSCVVITGCSVPPLAKQATTTYITAIPTAPPTMNVTITNEATPTTTQVEQVFLCDEVTIAPDEYIATDGDFVSLTRPGFVRDGVIIPIYGANYYPRNTPLMQFLRTFDADHIESELALMANAGLNTLRIFMHHKVLFGCDGLSAQPRATPFDHLDQLIRLAATYDLRLIVVLNTDIAPYDQLPLALAQARIIMTRYQNEPTILAWDLRDRGNRDYTMGRYDRTQVLAWLAEYSTMVRDYAPKHPITAGWWEDSLATAPYVDFVSFQHYGEYLPLRQTIANLRAETDKPILLTAIGYSTESLDETVQRNLLFQAFEEVRFNQLLGWNIYMAFDYPLSALCPDSANNCEDSVRNLQRYGVWNTSYFPKLAVDAIERVTGGK